MIRILIIYVFGINVTHMIIKISLILIIVFSLTNCTQSSYMSSNLETKNPITAVIMPDQTCIEKDNDRVLVGEKILHPAHKECYYK